MRTIRDVMDLDVKNLDLSVRCSNCMSRMNIKKLSELTAISKESMFKIRNMGKKSIEELDRKLAENGLWWEMNEQDWLTWGLSNIQWIKSH